MKMKRTIYLMVMLIAALALAIPAQAQKWPERSRVRRGNRAYERLDYGRAEERYRQAQELSDTCFEAKFNLGDALYKQQRYDEAEKIFTALAADSTRSDLDRAHSFYNLGNSLFQQKKNQVLSYMLAGQSGPDHDKQFDVEVSLNGAVVGKGSGRSKKRAEQMAAKAAVEKLFPQKV